MNSSPSRAVAKLGVQQQLALAVLLSVSLAALAVCATLFVFSQQRSYRDTVRRSTEMIEAASLAFSQATADQQHLIEQYSPSWVSR